MASPKTHHRPLPHRQPPAMPVVAPTAVSIGTSLQSYVVKGYPAASSIKRSTDNTLTQIRTAFFRMLATQPIVRHGLYDFVLRPDVLTRLQTEAPAAAAAITRAVQTAVAVQSLPPQFAPPPATACPMPGALLPDATLADAAAALHRCGLITVQGADNTMLAAILATQGNVSFAGLSFLKDREGGGAISDHLYWPHSSRLPDESGQNASGVTLGLGYDMKLRGKEAITSDLVGIGLDRPTAMAAAEGYHLRHANAHNFANSNEDLVRLTDDQQMRLLTLIIGTYEARVRRLVQADMAGRLLVCEFDALVSMNYQGALAQPVLRPVKSHDLVAAGVAIVGTTSAIYRERRMLEQALFNRAAYSPGAAG